MSEIPADILHIIEEATHRLKTETGTCHACKGTFRLGLLVPVAGCEYLLCDECKQKGDERLWQMIQEEMAKR